jgi:hypothetical protein
MRILVSEMMLTDVGPLDGALRLPTEARRRNGQRTQCVCCGTEVVSEYFIAGFKHGHANMILCESCPDDQVLTLLTRDKKHGEWASEQLLDRLMATDGGE